MRRTLEEIYKIDTKLPKKKLSHELANFMNTQMTQGKKITH